ALLPLSVDGASVTGPSLSRLGSMPWSQVSVSGLSSTSRSRFFFSALTAARTSFAIAQDGVGVAIRVRAAGEGAVAAQDADIAPDHRALRIAARVIVAPAILE